MPDVFELIQQFCPDGVEYRRLGDIGVFQNGKGISKSDLLDNGDIPVVHYGQIYTTYTHAFRETVSFVDKRTAVSVKAHHGDVVVCLTETADLGFVGKAVAQICGVDVGISGDAGVLHLNPTQVDARYLSYVMATECFQVQKEKCKRGTTVMHLNVPMWKKICVPVPPLPVQEEIVRILDAFDTYCNDMTAGLAGELAMRRKQFQYWREKLLTFDDSVERKALGEVLGVNRGKRLTKSDLSDSGYFDVYHGSKSVPLGKYSEWNVVANSIIVVNTGGVGEVKFLDCPFWCSDGSFWLGHNDCMVDKFVYYYVSQYEDYFSSKRRIGGVPTIDRTIVENLLIPIPSLQEQQEIVRVLDTFQELERELERELELRKKQFEYYRDRLLTFPEKVVN